MCEPGCVSLSLEEVSIIFFFLKADPTRKDVSQSEVGFRVSSGVWGTSMWIILKRNMFIECLHWLQMWCADGMLFQICSR